jgi:chemotaxis protein methyltransferase CheR
MQQPLLDDFIRLIGTRTGLRFAPGDQQGLERKLLARMAGRHCPTAEAYLQLLGRNTPESCTEWQELATLLTIGESYFFRDQGQIDLLRRRLLPELIAARQSRRRLRIWSAGCAGGEEPYSLAMLLRELLPAPEDWQILVLGTDLNGQALAKARRGRYSSWSFRGVDPALQRRYFTRDREEWLLCEEVRDMVVFQPGNLASDRFPDPGSELHDMDLILCRNTFIYFSPELVAAVAEKFADTLCDQGYLVTGHGELQLQQAGPLQARLLEDQVVFQKRSPGERPAASPEPAPAPSPRQPPAPRRSPTRPPPPVRGTPAAPPAEPSPAPSLLAEAQAALDRTDPETAMAKAQALLAAQPGDAQALLVLARAHADRGNYRQAEACCLQALEGAATDPAVHFLLAQLAEAAGDPATAREALQRTLYLDPGRVAALVELGQLLTRDGQTGKGLRLLRSARDLLAPLPPQARVPDYPELSAGELIRHLDALLQPGRGGH